MDELEQWSVRAVNLPEHADNPIHTDDGARRAGFPAALVAGVTVYAYLTRPPTAAWGVGWVRSGGAEVRFASPVFDGDLVDLRIDDPTDDAAVDELLEAPRRVGAFVDGGLRARCAVSSRAPALATRSGEQLRTERVTVDEALVDYGARAGDDNALYAAEGIAHPASWPALANRVFHRQVVTGPWIHVRSLIAHHDVARLGESLEVSATVVDRFASRAGPRAVAQVRITAGGRAIASLEHEAVIDAR